MVHRRSPVAAAISEIVILEAAISETVIIPKAVVSKGGLSETVTVISKVVREVVVHEAASERLVCDWMQYLWWPAERLAIATEWRLKRRRRIVEFIRV